MLSDTTSNVVSDHGSSVPATELAAESHETPCAVEVEPLDETRPTTSPPSDDDVNSPHQPKNPRAYTHAFTMRWVGLDMPAWLLLVMLASKFVSYGSLRMIYSLSPFLQEDWNVTNAEMGLIVASGEFGSLPAGFFIPFAELAGPRKSVPGMLLLVALGNALTTVNTSVIYLVVLRFLQSLCLTVFISCLQASGGCMVPPSQNLRLTAVLESGWGISLLVAVPLVGVIYQAAGWQAVYLVMGGVMLPVCAGLFLGLPSDFVALTHDSDDSPDVDTKGEDVQVNGADVDVNGDDVGPTAAEARQADPVVVESHSSDSSTPTVGVTVTSTARKSDVIVTVVNEKSTSQQQQQQERTGVIANAKAVFMVPAVRYNFAGILFSQAAINIMFALYSYWARDVHGKDVRETATYTLLIGVAELAGILALSQVERVRCVGLYASMIIALVVSGAVTLLAGVLGGYTFEGGLVGYMLLFVGAEFSTVAGIALVREVAPAKSLLPALGFYYQAMSIGRTIAALASPLFWEVYPALIWVAVWSTSVFALATALQLRGKFLHEKTD
jgi:predicted MFS family arabinose efflux permease